MKSHVDLIQKWCKLKLKIIFEQSEKKVFHKRFGERITGDGDCARRLSIFSSTFSIKLCGEIRLHSHRLRSRQKINKVWTTKTKLWNDRRKIMKISSFIKFYWKLSLKNVNFNKFFLFSMTRHLMRPLKASLMKKFEFLFERRVKDAN